MGLINDIYKRLWQEKELYELLGEPMNGAQRQERIRRQITPVSEITADKLNFMQLYFGSTIETNNIYIVRGFLHVDYFAKTFTDARKMKLIVNDVLQEMDIFCVSKSNIPSKSKGIYIFSERYRPMVWA